MDTVNVNNPDLWRSLGAIFGPGGLALLLAFAAALYFNFMQWTRAKEQDKQCQEEREKVLANAGAAMKDAEARWETRFQQMRSDVKEGFGIVAKLTEQVTLLGVRGNGTRTP